MTDLENLQARRSEIYSELAAMTSTSSQPGGKPNANGVSQLDHVGFKDGLYRELTFINQQISRLDVFEINSEMSA